MNWKIAVVGIFIVIMFSLIGIFSLKPIGFNKNGINPLESKNMTKEKKQTGNS